MIPDPLSQMFSLLTARRNRALIQQWGVWLAGKDVERALKVGQCQAIYSPLGTHLMNVCGNVPQLLTAHGSTKRGHKAEDEAATLQQIRAVNPEAGVRFLEHLVLQKRRTVSPQDLSVHSPVSYLISQDPALHTELALTYIDEVLAFVADDAISKLWRAKGTRLSPRICTAQMPTTPLCKRRPMRLLQTPPRSSPISNQRPPHHRPNTRVCERRYSCKRPPRTTRPQQGRASHHMPHCLRLNSPSSPVRYVACTTNS